MREILNPGLKYYVDMINAGSCYTWIRLGDGEWSSIVQDRVRTSSGSQTLNHKSLQRAMTKVIVRAPNDPRYILALRQTSYRANITTWLEQHTPEHIRWHDCTVLYKASSKGRLYPFIKALRELSVPIILIGPRRLAKLHSKVFDISKHVIIPNQNCWAQRQDIMSRALETQEPACYLVSAGPAAKPFCWSLHHRIGQHSWIIDCGSLWDPYVGRATRIYHKAMLKNPDIMSRNLGQNS